jgi:hypothetical protein
MSVARLAAVALAATALLAAPAQAAPAQAICGGDISIRGRTGDLFRPCGPLITCP